ncbi:GNAT family N-acyltransferase [Pelomonas sp. SE-A7]|uniref:GNAT family N-acetyltransferase n=1 Tax=Pelomonas sp. SE-A7 TaxID=3054953 RepID=UPI00259C83B1|nr:GNAT family N-acyltransferase [Pelomonas sp. SE-A7]MDM4767968.1 GNAT family N-acyltransferase [Pelomonas sp. SE-A7]
MRDLPLPTLPFAELNSADRRSLPAALPQTVATPRLHVAWARTQDDLIEAQSLRYQVFVGEMGARLTPPAGTPTGLDVDRFDEFCEHLLVRTVEVDGRPGEVIGTYRVLTPDAARRAGGLYSETEFDLSPLASLRSRMVELGRSCVHADHRSGGAIMSLWAALGEFMQRNQLDTMIGCASVSMRDGGHYAASLWKRLEQSHLAAPEWQVQPKLALPVAELDQNLDADPPPLIKGYLRCGARVLGAPAWDPDFNTADLPLLMRIPDLPARYRRHFLGE